jgi:hypothetical protein
MAVEFKTENGGDNADLVPNQDLESEADFEIISFKTVDEIEKSIPFPGHISNQQLSSSSNERLS